MITQIIAIVSFVGAIALAINSWINKREAREDKIANDLEKSQTQYDHEKEILEIEQNHFKGELDGKFKFLETEMRLLRDKASERHGEVQARIGNMELQLKEFMRSIEKRNDHL